MEGTLPRRTIGAEAMRALRLAGLVMGGLLIAIIADLVVGMLLFGVSVLLSPLGFSLEPLPSPILIAMGFGYVAVLMSLSPLLALVVARGKPRLGVTVWWLLLVGSVYRLISALGMLTSGNRGLFMNSYSFAFYDFKRGPVPLLAAAIALAACSTLVVLFAHRDWRRIPRMAEPSLCDSDADVGECRAEQALPADGGSGTLTSR